MRLLLLLSLCVFLSTHVANAEENAWKYPNGGPTGESQMTHGEMGKFQALDVTTSDSIEKVVLWYTKKVGIEDDSSFVKDLKKGFDKGRKPAGHCVSFGHLNGDAPWLTIVRSTIKNGHMHIHIMHRPKTKDGDISLSFSSDGKETTIMVMRPLPSEEKKSVKTVGLKN